MNKPLTKSLHTVTAVARVAVYLQRKNKTKKPAGELAVDALRVLGYDPQAFEKGVYDPTFLHCIEAIKKLEAPCANKPKR